MNTLHARIKSTRLDRGLSQTDLANQSGVSQPTVANWENGSHVPRRDALFRISKILGVEAIWLLSGENSLARSPAQHYLNKPIKHVPIYSWPFSMAEFSQQKPETYYPFATDHRHVFGFLSDGSMQPDEALLIFEGGVSGISKGDLCLIDDGDGPQLQKFHTDMKMESVIARLKTTIINH